MMDFDDSIAKSAFIKHYETDYYSAKIDQPDVLCAYRAMWDYIDGDTKKYLFEIMVNLNVERSNEIFVHKAQLERRFGIPFEEMDTKISSSLEEAYGQAHLKCIAPQP